MKPCETCKKPIPEQRLKYRSKAKFCSWKCYVGHHKTEPKYRRCRACKKKLAIHNFYVGRGVHFRICVSCHTSRTKEYSLAIKLRVIAHYGGQCACCRESRHQFLAAHHLNGNGASHRKRIKSVGGYSFYLWLVRHDFPADYGILCHNCNFAVSAYGSCPHSS
jgi:hypothetical protein